MNKQKLLPIKHASASDWDFTSTDWSIQTNKYVSPPSSLRWLLKDGTGDSFGLCKATGTHKLPQGRLVTYFHTHYGYFGLWLLFRNTSPIGSANHNNGYKLYCEDYSGPWTLYEYLGGVIQRQWSTSFGGLPPDIWRRFRLSWWLSWGVLQVRLEHEVDDEWVRDGDDISISDPLFGEEDIQRCGVGCIYTYDDYVSYIDDTEIWEYP